MYSCPRISDAGVRTLNEGWKYCPFLESISINLANCSLVTNKGMLSLTAGWKHLKVLRSVDFNLRE